MSLIINKNEPSSALRTIPFWIGSGTTGLTWSSSHLQLSKNGGTEANYAGSVSELGGGVYKYVADIGELNTEGSLCIRFNRIGVVAAPTIVQIASVSGLNVNLVAINTSPASGATTINTNVTAWAGTTIPTPQVTGIPDCNIRFINSSAASGAGVVSANVTLWNGSGVLNSNVAGAPVVTISNGTGAGQLSIVNGYVSVTGVADKSGYSITNAAATGIAQAVWNSLRSNHTTGGSFGQGVASALIVGNVTGVLSFPVSVSGCNENLKTGFSLSSSQAFNNSGTQATVTTLTNGVTVTTNNDKSGYVLHPTGVDAIWDEARSGHVTAGTFGEGISSVQGNVTGSVGSVIDGAAIAASVAAFECDGYSVENILATILSFMAGKVDVQDNGNNREITYYRQDGSTAKFSIIANKSNGSRATGGSIG